MSNLPLMICSMWFLSTQGQRFVTSVVGEGLVPVIVKGGTLTAGGREGGRGEDCLGGAGGFALSAMLGRTDEACEERPNRFDGRWRCEL